MEGRSLLLIPVQVQRTGSLHTGDHGWYLMNISLISLSVHEGQRRSFSWSKISFHLSVTVVCYVSLLLAPTNYRGRVYLSARALRAPGSTDSQ